MRLSESARWRIARAATRLPWACWADLVSWVFDPDGYYNLRGALTNRHCRQGAATGCGVCYCGKVATQAMVDAHPDLLIRPVVLDQAAVRRLHEPRSR